MNMRVVGNDEHSFDWYVPVRSENVREGGRLHYLVGSILRGPDASKCVNIKYIFSCRARSLEFENLGCFLGIMFIVLAATLAAAFFAAAHLAGR